MIDKLTEIDAVVWVELIHDGNRFAGEINQSVFKSWDKNRDGFLDRKEYDTYGNLYYDTNPEE